MAKYSPQRWSSHRPVASSTSTTAYPAAIRASHVSVLELSVNACLISPTSFEWSTL